ncbi:MAG: type II 3-dehydroquinate dehydratase [Proteobacteria bacterium]|nr:type II 3-dehydroquinate dehydratase [Pseudomonadota bacterium]
MKILVLQGPNLNLLGTREPEIYGSATLDDVQRDLDALAGELDVVLEHFQSNHEGDLVDRVQQARDEGMDGALVNAGGLTHSSVSLRDALVGCELPFVEVHVSNVYAREPFRKTNLLADVALGGVVGLGVHGYELALRGLVGKLSR